MKKTISLAALALVATPPAALAQVTILGGGIAKECFEAAKYEKLSPQEGEAICTRAIESEAMTPGNRAATYTNRGVLRMRATKYDKALSDYETAKKLKPEAGEVYLNEGAAYIFLKDYPNALEALTTAIGLQSSDLHAAYYNRAIAKEKLGDVQGAYFDFLKAVELKPEWELAQWQLSRFEVTTN